MSVFIGGSAYNMVRDVAEGYILATERTFRKYGPKELGDFVQEANRLLTEIRSEQPSLTDTAAIQKRQRKMQRLMQALSISSSALERQRRG